MGSGAHFWQVPKMGILDGEETSHVIKSESLAPAPP
jgi:hypothetical protein